MNKTTFTKEVGISSNAILAKLSKNEFISMEIIVKFCKYLDCTIDEIIDIKK